MAHPQTRKHPCAALQHDTKFPKLPSGDMCWTNWLRLSCFCLHRGTKKQNIRLLFECRRISYWSKIAIVSPAELASLQTPSPSPAELSVSLLFTVHYNDVVQPRRRVSSWKFWVVVTYSFQTALPSFFTAQAYSKFLGQKSPEIMNYWIWDSRISACCIKLSRDFDAMHGHVEVICSSLCKLSHLLIEVFEQLVCFSSKQWMRELPPLIWKSSRRVY